MVGRTIEMASGVASRFTWIPIETKRAQKAPLDWRFNFAFAGPRLV